MQDYLQWMEQARFHNVDCVWKYLLRVLAVCGFDLHTPRRHPGHQVHQNCYLAKTGAQIVKHILGAPVNLIDQIQDGASWRGLMVHHVHLCLAANVTTEPLKKIGIGFPKTLVECPGGETPFGVELGVALESREPRLNHLRAMPIRLASVTPSQTPRARGTNDM